MKSFNRVTTWLFMAFGVVSAITAQAAYTPTASPAVETNQAAKLKVFVSSPQMESLVLEALGDSVEIYVMLGAHDDPHTYEPTLDDLLHYKEADVILLENSIASLKSQEHRGKKFIIWEHPDFERYCTRHGINRDNEHLAYNIFAYQTALDILVQEVLTEEQKEIHASRLEKVQEAILLFILTIEGSARALATGDEYVVIVAAEGIGNPLVEHWISRLVIDRADRMTFINATSTLITLKTSSLGCGHPGHNEISGKEVEEIIQQLHEAVDPNKKPNRIIFIGDKATIAQLKAVRELNNLQADYLYIELPHNMDKKQHESFIHWLYEPLVIFCLGVLEGKVTSWSYKDDRGEITLTQRR